MPMRLKRAGKNMPKKAPTAAVIDIGSNELRLHIAQAPKQPTEKDSEKIEYLESLVYPLSLGRETFFEGKMSFDKVDQACDVIKNFLHVSRDYGVRNVYTVAGTAMREAENMDFILDQIKIKTGIDVQVIDDLEEKRHIYKLLTHHAEDFLKKSAVIVYIGTGSMGVSLFIDGKMARTWNIRVGSLRMGELFGDLQEFTREFYRLMEEYLAGITYKLRNELPKGIQHFIVSGPEIELIAKLVISKGTPPFGVPLFDIPRKDFDEFYEKIKRKTTDKIASDYALDGDIAESLLPAACIYQNLLNCTSAKAITASRMLPCDAVLFEMLYPKRFAAIEKRFDKGTVLSAREIALKYHANIPHIEQVRDFALMIYDKIKKLHGLGGRDKLLLTAAALLHDIGEYINTLDHHEISYEMVRRSDIVGLTHGEIEIVALLCRYHSGEAVPDLKEPCYANLNASTRVRVSKLAAMLRLADSLDLGRAQKCHNIDVKLSDGMLNITINTSANMALEQWAFADKGQFFAEVFGIKAMLKIKKL